VLDIEVPVDELVVRLAGRLVCRAGSHPYHALYAPPAVPGVCDIDGSELYQRDDDQPDVVRTRFQKQWVEAAAPVIEYYRGHGLVSNIVAARPREQVSAALDALLDGLGRRS
jgi:adenylate kinase